MATPTKKELTKIEEPKFVINLSDLPYGHSILLNTKDHSSFCEIIARAEIITSTYTPEGAAIRPISSKDFNSHVLSEKEYFKFKTEYLLNGDTIND